MTRENPWKGDPNSSPMSHEEISARFAEAFEGEFNTSSKPQSTEGCVHCEITDKLRDMHMQFEVDYPEPAEAFMFYRVLGVAVDTLLREDKDAMRAMKAFVQGLEGSVSNAIARDSIDIVDILGAILDKGSKS